MKKIGIIAMDESNNELRIYTPKGVYTYDYITEKFLSLFEVWWRGYTLVYDALSWKFLDLYIEIEEEQIEEVFDALKVGEKFPINELIDWEIIKKETEDHDFSLSPYVMFYAYEVIRNSEVI
jgi:hypothetical protein